MCIALLTTAHPQYALIVINNRDEFILRPTSKPHWWTTTTQHPHSPSSQNNHTNGVDHETQHVLSSRDLLRKEQGTWLGITKAGHLAVLTNYRELDPSTGAPSITGQRSRGAVVNDWLSASSSQTVSNFVTSIIADGGTRGVGGFSLICGKLRRSGERELAPLAILSNKAENPDEIPWIASARGQTVGLSNAAFDAPFEWPKVRKGKALLEDAIKEAVKRELKEEELVQSLLKMMEQDDLPRDEGMRFEDYLKELQQSIFIPPLGDQEHRAAMAKMTAQADNAGNETREAVYTLPDEVLDPEPSQQSTPPVFNTGMYGTQRQTVILVDWEGNVTYTERALYSETGQVIPKGKGDMTFRFGIEGWNETE